MQSTPKRNRVSCLSIVDKRRMSPLGGRRVSATGGRRVATRSFLGSRPFGSTFDGSFQVFCCSQDVRTEQCLDVFVHCLLLGVRRIASYSRLQRVWMLHWPPTSVTQLSLWFPRDLL